MTVEHINGVWHVDRLPIHGATSAEGALQAYAELMSPLPVTAADVRAEASRRMQALLGARDADHLAVIISNAQRESARLYAIRLGIPGVVAGREWTADEAHRAAELYVADQAIEAIRAASNAMEGAPPTDYADDARWP